MPAPRAKKPPAEPIVEDQFRSALKRLLATPPRPNDKPDVRRKRAAAKLQRS